MPPQETTLKTLQQIIDDLNASLVDADKFDRGNATAGTRLRTAALETRKKLDTLRRTVQEVKTARKSD